MIVQFQKDKDKAKEVELFIVGNSFAVQDGKSTMRIGPLSPGQWRLVANSAKDKAIPE